MATSSVDARSGRDGAPDGAPVGAPLTPQLSALLADLQSRGLRVEDALEARRGGAGPADAGMLWVEGVAVTVPVAAPFVAGSPYLLRGEEEDEYAIYRDGERVASARRTTRPVPPFVTMPSSGGTPPRQTALGCTCTRGSRSPVWW